MATTKADLEARIAELEAQLAAPSAEASPLDRRKANADNTTVGIITGVYPVQRRDGSVVDGGYRVRVRIGAQVNFGDSEEPQRRRIPVEQIYFTIWDNGTAVATELVEAMSGHSWMCCRLYWEYSGNPRAVQTRQVTNPNTGNTYTEEYFAYTPDKRIFAYDVLSCGGNAPARQPVRQQAEDLGLPPIQRREPEPVEDGDIPF
jgi:hypothetical protein